MNPENFFFWTFSEKKNASVLTTVNCEEQLPTPTAYLDQHPKFDMPNLTPWPKLVLKDAAAYAFVVQF